MKRGLIVLMGLAAASVALAGCGKTVETGNEGIMIRNVGSQAGVQEQPLGVGFHMTGIGEHIIEYPIITRNYSFARAGDGDNKSLNEEIVFADSIGTEIHADVQATLAVEPGKVADIYKKYRLDFDALRDGPIRAQIRTDIAAEAAKYPAQEILSLHRADVIKAALVDVQEHFKGTGVVVSDLQWLGNLRPPQNVIDSINETTRVNQQTQIAVANQKRAEAEAAAKVAQAEGDKKVKELEAEALNTAGGEKTLRKQWIEKWDGKLPQYVLGSQVSTLMQMGGDGK